MCNNKLTDVGIFIINYTFHYHLIIVKHRLTGKNCINDSYTFVVMLKGSVLLMEWLRVFWYHSKNLSFNQCTKCHITILNLTGLTIGALGYTLWLVLPTLVPSPQRLHGDMATQVRGPADTMKTILGRIPERYWDERVTSEFGKLNFCLIPAKRN